MADINFESIKTKILPYFIKVYGEEYRNVIVSRMDKIEPIFYYKVEDLKNKMNLEKSAKRVELTMKFLENNNINIPNDLKKGMLDNRSTYELSNIPEAIKLLKICFDGNSYNDSIYGKISDIYLKPTDDRNIIAKSIYALKRFDINISKENYNTWVNTKEAEELSTYIEKLMNTIEPLDAEYKEFVNSYDDIEKIIENSNNIESELKQKYTIEYLKSLDKYMNEKDKKMFKEYLSSSNNDWYSFKNDIDIFKITGDIFLGNGIIDAFSEDADNKLNNPETSNFVCQSILDDRIKYYTLMGMYKNDMSKEEFLNSDSAKIHRPRKELVNDIISKRIDFRKKYESEILESTSSYKENMSKINDLNLETDASFTLDNMKNGTICINPNVKINNGTIEPSALLFFSPSAALPQYVDVQFIHEVNHAIELSLLDYNTTDRKATYKCGFEDISDYGTERPNVEFSETINQLIAMEVTELMHQDNVYLFNDSKTAKIHGGTSYERQNVLVNNFWKLFKKDIMKSRMDNNLDSLYAVVGKENFEKLNCLINEYKQMPYYQMMNDVVNNKNTEFSQKHATILANVNTITNKMAEYSNYDKTSSTVMGM